MRRKCHIGDTLVCNCHLVFIAAINCHAQRRCSKMPGTVDDTSPPSSSHTRTHALPPGTKQRPLRPAQWPRRAARHTHINVGMPYRILYGCHVCRPSTFCQTNHPFHTPRSNMLTVYRQHHSERLPNDAIPPRVLFLLVKTTHTHITYVRLRVS